MTSRGFERMRLKSHALIRRRLLRERLQRGDRRFSCQYWSRSPFLLCAVNPSGPCNTCSHYCPPPEGNR